MRHKIVVVTGASSGIGEDCALKLAAAGATVILAARTPQKLQATLDKIQAQGGKAHAYACDIADMADCERFVKTVLDEHRHVDILINNAGRSIRRSVKFSFDRFHDFERTMQLNYFGALKLIFGFAPKMLERKSGHIINISSIGVLASPPRFSAYVASKAALDAFSWCAAPEFADSNVRFTTVNMPLVRTPMIAPTRLYDAFPTLSPDQAAELVMSAVIDKPKRVATGLGLAGAVAQAVAPGVSEFVLNQAYRLFPDSAAARGLSEEEAAAEMAKLPKMPVDLARKLFAQVFSGVHWQRNARSAIGEREALGHRRRRQALVVAGQRGHQAAAAQEDHRRQVQRVERAHRLGKGLQGTDQHLGRHLDQVGAVHQLACGSAVRRRGTACMHTVEDLVLQQAAGHEGLRPEGIGRRTVLGKEARQHHRRVQVDQRSARSPSSSRSTPSMLVTGLRRGSLALGGTLAGARRPCRSRSPRRRSAGDASARMRGDTSSATTWPRSVTRTVSPAAAARTYSLRRFFRTLMPTRCMRPNVATGGYIVKRRLGRVSGTD